MSLTTTEVFGFIDSCNQAFADNAALLLTKQVTVGPWITEGGTFKSTAVTKNGLQEAGKTSLKILTTDTQTALQAAYDYYSSKLDAAAAAVGKTTPKGKELLKLRSKIRNKPKNTPPTPPTP